MYWKQKRWLTKIHINLISFRLIEQLTPAAAKIETNMLI